MSYQLNEWMAGRLNEGFNELFRKDFHGIKMNEVDIKAAPAMFYLIWIYIFLMKIRINLSKENVLFRIKLLERICERQYYF